MRAKEKISGIDLEDMAGNNVTIKDIAKEANVSIATVSRILNGLGGYGKQAESKVRGAISRLKDERNNVARNLKMRKANTIAMVLASSLTDFYLPILQAVSNEVERRGYSLKLYFSESTVESVERKLVQLRQNLLVGALFCGHQPDPRLDELLLSENLPCVFVCDESHSRKIGFQLTRP